MSGQEDRVAASRIKLYEQRILRWLGSCASLCSTWGSNRRTERTCCYNTICGYLCTMLPRRIAHSLLLQNPNATLCNAMVMYLYCSLSSASSTVTARFVTFCPSRLLPATAELEPSASFRSGRSPKLQLDSSELGAAGLGDELVVGAVAVVVPEGAGCTGVESACD